jgi:hypothetical protein
VRLALIQFRRAPIRSVLLIFVVGILVFLVEFLATISATLQAFNTGALRNLRADVLVYGGAADGSLDASRLPARIQAAAERVAGWRAPHRSAWPTSPRQARRADTNWC